MDQVIQIVANLQDNITNKLSKIIANFASLSSSIGSAFRGVGSMISNLNSSIADLGKNIDRNVLSKVKDLIKFSRNGGIEFTLLSDYSQEPFRLNLDEHFAKATERFVNVGLDYFKKAIAAPFNFLRKALPERVGDEMSDVKSAGGIYSVIMRMDKPIIGSFREAEELTKETNRYLAELAGALPGRTEEYIAVSKQIADGIVQMIAEDKKNAIVLAKEIAAENGRVIKSTTETEEVKGTITELIGEMTKLTVLAGLGSQNVGPYGLPMLVERMISEDQVSLGMFQRYAAIFREPMIRTALERNIGEINKTGKNTAKRYKALMQTFEQIVTPELVRRYQRTISGSLEAVRTSLLSPEVGLLGLGRPLEIVSKKYNEFGRVMVDDAGAIMEENLSIFDFLRDIFFNISWVTIPLIDSVVSLYDPFYNLGVALDGIRVSTMAFQDTYERYLEWLVKEHIETFEDQKDKTALMATARLRSALATFSSYLYEFGDITGGEFYAISQLLRNPDFENFGELIRRMIQDFMKGNWAREIGKAIGGVVGTILATVAEIITGTSDLLTGSTLLAGFREGFKNAGGEGTLKTILGSIFGLMFKGLWFIFKEFFWEILFAGGLFTFLPVILSSLARNLVRIIVGAVQRGASGLLGKTASFGALKKGVAAKGGLLKIIPGLGLLAGLGSFVGSVRSGEGVGKAAAGGVGAAAGTVKGSVLGAKLGLLAIPFLGPLGPILGSIIFGTLGFLTGEWVGKNSAKLVAQIGKWVDGLLNKVAEGVGYYFAKLPQMFYSFTSSVIGFSEKVSKFLTNEDGYADEIFNSFRMGFSELNTNIQTEISNFFTRLRESFFRVFNEGQPETPDRIGNGRQDWEQSNTPIGQRISETWAKATIAASQLPAFLLGLIIGGLANLLFKIVPSVVKFFWDLRATIITELTKFGLNILKNIVSWFTDPSNRSELDFTIGDFLSNVVNSINGALGNFFSEIAKAFWEGVKRGWNPSGQGEENSSSGPRRQGFSGRIFNRGNNVQPMPDSGPRYKGSFGTDSFMPLPRAIQTELKHKPPGSNLVIANSSELIIPTKAAAKGNGDITVLTTPLNHIASTNSNALQYLNNILQKNNEVKNEVSQLKVDNANRLNNVALLTNAVGSILQSGIRTEVVNAVRVEVVNTPTVTSNFSFGGESMGPIGGGIGNFPMTSPYGWRDGRMHQGNDYGMPVGTKLALGIPGQVLSAGWAGGYGMNMDILGADGVMYRFAHLSRYLLPPGASVVPNVPFALSGNTGRSTGPHLHFEAHPGGRGAVNPTPFAGVIRANYAGMEMPEVMGAIGGELANMPYGSDLVVGNSNEIMMKPNQAANLVSSSVRAGMQGSGSVTVSGITINVNGANKSGRELAEEIASHIMDAIESANYSGVYG